MRSAYKSRYERYDKAAGRQARIFIPEAVLNWKNVLGSAGMKQIVVEAEFARVLGVLGGTIPTGRLLEQAIREKWCSPLVMAGACEVFDFSTGYDPDRKLTAPYGIGRYDEDRRGMYETALFKSDVVPRTIHMGLDIGAVEGTPVFSPFDAVIWGADYLSAEGDYGGTVILESFGASERVFSLLGHLSFATQRRWKRGDRIGRGELVGWLGAKSENGGWNPHLHWQLSRLEPQKVDLPGAVRPSERELARLVFPDPTELLKAAIGGWK